MTKTIRHPIAVLLAAAMFFCLPLHPCAAATEEDDDSINGIITLGIFLVVVGVLFYVGFKTDRELAAQARQDLRLAEPHALRLPDDAGLESEPAAVLARAGGVEFRF